MKHGMAWMTVILATLWLQGCAWLGERLPGSSPESGKQASEAAEQENADHREIKQNLVEAVVTEQAGYPRQRAPGSFYVALKTIPEWRQDSRSDCMDDGVFAGMRRLFRADAAQIALIASLSWSGQPQPLRVPLFVVGRDEAPETGKPSCFSEVVERKLTPMLRADKNVSFKVDFEVYSSSAANFKLAEQLVSLGSEALNLSSGGSAWLMQQLAGERFQAASKRINEALESGWSAASSDKYSTTFQVFPDTAGWEGHIDGWRFDLGPLVTRQGIREGEAVPTITVQMIYGESLFGHDGHYPEDPAAVLSTGISSGSGQEEFTLNKLLQKGINNVTREYLRGAVEQSQMENYCIALREEFGRHLSPSDALVARYSAVKLHSYYDRSKALRSSKCFDDRELQALEQMGYGFTELERKIKANRARQVEELLDPLVKAIKAADAETLRRVLPEDENIRLELWDAEVLPNAEHDWGAADRETTIQRLLAVGMRQPLLGCYQAPPDTTLTLLGLIARVDGKASGWALHFKEGRLTEITIGELRKIRKFARLPEDWTENCPLI